METQYINTPEQLESLCNVIQQESLLALDTEFIRERTYYPILGLIQISVADKLYCVDPLAISDLGRLYTLICDPARIKIFHAGSQDLEILMRCACDEIHNIFDTQIAASFLGEDAQISYAGLVEHVFGVSLDKSHSRTNWLQRPLDEKQVQYAYDDVRYLIPLYEKQIELLKSKGRYEWFAEECKNMTDKSSIVPGCQEVALKVKGLAKLSVAQVKRFVELFCWREELAAERDIPRRNVLSDDTLFMLACGEFQSVNDLAGANLKKSHIERYAQQWLDCLEQAEHRQIPEEDMPYILSRPQQDLLKKLGKVARATAANLEISPTRLATRRQLKKLLFHPDKSELLNGWRADLVAEKLKVVLAERAQ